MDMDPQTNELYQEIVNTIFDEEYISGIHQLLHARHFSLIDNYNYEGNLYSRSAVLLNGLCHVTVTEDFDCDFILSLGAVPTLDECVINHWKLPLVIEVMAESCLDEWELKGDEEALNYESFTCFSMDRLIDAAESQERDQIQPVLSAFMQVFSSYYTFFLDVEDSSLECPFNCEVMTDETLEAAFTAFVTFIKDTILPKLTLANLKMTQNTKLN